MRAFVFALAVAAAASTAAVAANPPLVSPTATPWIGVRAKAMQTWPTLTCGTAACTPATPEELAHPPISDGEAREIYLRGFYSGAAEHCGLDWRTRNYAPTMAWWRDTAHRSVRDMALVGAIHDIAQSMAKTALGRTGQCTADLKADIDKRLNFRPPAGR